MKLEIIMEIIFTKGTASTAAGFALPSFFNLILICLYAIFSYLSSKNYAFTPSKPFCEWSVFTKIQKLNCYWNKVCVIEFVTWIMCVCVSLRHVAYSKMCVWLTMVSSSGVLPVDIITCAVMTDASQKHTAVQQSFLNFASVSRGPCPGQKLLFISVMPPQSQTRPDINTWPSAKWPAPQCLCLNQPIARSAAINPVILLHVPGGGRKACFHSRNGATDMERISSPVFWL